MSSDSLAILRRNIGPELAQLAENHIQHDLRDSDREALNSAAKKLSTYTTIGSLVGLGLGVVLAFRVRSVRAQAFKAIRAVEKPTHVRFADGREEAIPDLTPLLAPSTLGDVAAYMFFGAGGLFIGGELGLLSGSVGARNTITRDPETRKRIEMAFRGFKVDVLKKQIKELEGQNGVSATALEMW